MTLREVPVGGRVRVTGWHGAHPPPRLLEMGLLPGTVVEVVRLAPLGDPIDLRLRGYHLSIRRHEAEQVVVEAMG